jgi:hypothetical protein
MKKTFSVTVLKTVVAIVGESRPIISKKWMAAIVGYIRPIFP